MQAYAEGFDILANAESRRAAGRRSASSLDLADVAEVWRRGSVISSWLLDLTSIALAGDAKLDNIPASCRIPAKAAGRSRRRSTRPCRPTCFRPRSTRASARARSTHSPTSFSRRCGTVSAATQEPDMAAEFRVAARRGARADEQPALRIADDAPARRAGAALRDRDFRRDGRSHQPPAHAGFVQSVARSFCRRSSRSSASAAPRSTDEACARTSRKRSKASSSDKTAEFSADKIDQDAWSSVVDTIEYIDGDIGDPALYDEIKAEIDKFSRSGVRLQRPVLSRRRREILRPRRRQSRQSRTDEGEGFVAGAASSSRSRSATISIRRRAQRANARGPLRGPDLPHRPFPRQGNGAEHHGAAVRQRLLRADLEPRPYRSCADHGRGDGRRREARQLLRGTPARCATWCRTISSSCSR